MDARACDGRWRGPWTSPRTGEDGRLTASHRWWEGPLAGCMLASPQAEGFKVFSEMEQPVMRTTRCLSNRRGRGVVIALMIAVVLVITLWAGSGIAAPGHQPDLTTSRGQNVDYLSASDARSLGVGI